MFPLGLLTREILKFVEVGKILVVGEDLKRVSSTKKIVSPFSEGKDDRSNLQIGGMVVAFSIGEGIGDVGDRMPPIILFLREDCTNSDTRAVGFDMERVIGSGHGKSGVFLPDKISQTLRNICQTTNPISTDTRP